MIGAGQRRGGGRHPFRIIGPLAAGLALAAACAHSGQEQTTAPSAEGGADRSRLERIAELVEADIAQKRLPGAVVLVGRADRTVYHEAIGHRALVPEAEPMTRDTIFDVASLTKPVATATSIMALVEDGRIRLTDRVALSGWWRMRRGRP